MKLNILNTIGKQHYNAVICKYNNYIDDCEKNYDLILDEYFTTKKEGIKAIKEILKNYKKSNLDCFIVKINKKGNYITTYHY